MKKSFIFGIVLSTALVVVVGCKTEREEDATEQKGRYGFQGQPKPDRTPTPEVETQYAPIDAPKPKPAEENPESLGGEDSNNRVIVSTDTPTQRPVSQSRDLSYGTPIPGKAGFVASPHSPYAGYVDVRGYATGTEVKCPYSGKVFLVP